MKELFLSLSLEPFRAKQVLSWIYKKGATGFEEMTDLSKPARALLSEKAEVLAALPKMTERSRERGTVKTVFKAPDGAMFEAVKIKSSERTTICVSSQAGCAMKCKFCATGKGGYGRNLSTGEILEQALHFSRKEEVSNIVFMGMGEPFLNYTAVMKALRIINSKDGMGMGARRLTVSTCGLPEYIRKFAAEEIEVNLSVSLNAPNDAARNKIMPINRKYPVYEVLKAVKYYIQRTNRRVTFEYVLIKGLNDTIKDAKELASLLSGMLCHVNLIPFNIVPGTGFEPSSEERMTLFQQLLVRSGVNATIRKSKGSDIKAACGQLVSSVGR